MKNFRAPLLLALAILSLLCGQACSGRAKETSEDSIIALGGSVSRDQAGHITRIHFGTLANIYGGEFSSIRNLPHLSEIAIMCHGLTRQDYKVIGAYPQLRHVVLAECSTLDNEALRLVLTNKQIEELYLGGGTFDDDGLKGIAELGKLSELWLRETKVTSRGTLAISACRSLTFLDLSKTQVDDTAISHLSTMPRLTSLHLHHTNLTDASIESFGKMKQLEILDLNDTHLSHEGFSRLRLLLPKCKIYGGD